eukprot:207035_1
MSFEYQRDGVELSPGDLPCHIQRTVSGVLEHRCPQFDYYRRFVPVCEVSPPLHGYIKGQQQESHMVLPGDISFVCDDGYHFPGDSNFKKLEKIISCDPMDNGLEAEMAEELPKKCVQFCAISAPVNGKVDARPSLAVTVNRSFTMKCNAGYRLRNITTLSSQRVSAREFKCVSHGQTEKVSLALDAAHQPMNTECNPFCEASPFENANVNGQNTESLDVEPGGVVKFQCTGGSQFPDGSVVKEVTCKSPTDGLVVKLHHTVGACTLPDSVILAKEFMLYIVIAISGLTLLAFTVSKIIHCRDLRGDIDNLVLLVIGINLIDVFSDAAFTFEQYELNGWAKHFSAAFLVFPVFCNCV